MNYLNAIKEYISNTLFPLFIFDLDGTLVWDDKIDPNSINLLYAIQEIGISVGIATGRTYLRAKKFIDIIQPKGPVILGDGQSIYQYESKNHISFIPFPVDEYNFLLQYIFEYKELRYIDVVEEYVNTYHASSRRAARTFYLSIIPYGSKILYSDIKKDMPSIVTAFFSIPITDKRYIQFKKVIEEFNYKDNKLNVLQYSSLWYRTNIKDKNKAMVLENKELFPQKFIYFGDGENDIEIMKKSEFCFAMSHASDKVKAVKNCFTLTESLNNVLNRIIINIGR